jgi:hypothetical protein
MALPQVPYSSHVRDEILRRIAAGERLRAICAEDGMPCCETVTGWARRDLSGFNLALEAAYAQGAWRRRHACDPEVARAILAELGQGRRLEEVVRGPGMPSLRTFMAWKADHAWIAEAYGQVRAGREQVRREAARGRWRAFDPAVAERLYLRLWKGEGLRQVLRSEAAFPSLMVFARWRRENREFDAQMRFVLGGWRKKRGRARTLCTPEMVEAITDAIVTGASLRSLAARPDMPSARAMYGWVRTKPEFAAAVARACEIREDWFHDQIFAMELTATPGTVREVRRRTAPLRKQVTRLRKRPGWKAGRPAGAGR